MVFTPENYMSVTDVSEQTQLHQSTLYAYLNKGLIKDAYKFAGTRWIIPVQWVEDYLLGKIEIKGAFKGLYKGPERQQKFRSAKKQEEESKPCN